MMNKKYTTLACLIALFAAQDLFAQPTATFFSSSRDPNAAEIADDAALTGQTINEFFVTTSSDILQVDMVDISIGGASLFQHGSGDDDAPPLPAFVNVFPSLGADTWITTPGGTAIAGGGFGDPGSAWFDSDNNGAQNMFKFAQLTSSGEGTFSGRIQLQDTAGPVAIAFDDLPVGGSGPDPNDNTPPVVDNLVLAEIWDQETKAFNNQTNDYQLQGTDAEDGDDANLSWVLDNFTGPGAPANAPTVSATGLFQWDPIGSTNGFYFADVTVTDSGGLSDSGVLRIQVPEPSTMLLAGLSLVGVFARRRNS